MQLRAPLATISYGHYRANLLKFTMILIFSVVIFQASPTMGGRTCALQECKLCPTREQILSPGVGFALEMGYGTAVVRHHNETYQAIAVVEGSESYKSLLRRLAKVKPEIREPDPLDMPTLSEKIQWLKQQAIRLLKKSIGLPATPETATLADVLRQLKIETEAAIGAPVKRAVLSSPDPVGLTDQETSDLFDYLGIANVMRSKEAGGLNFHQRALGAAYAGLLGRGLCKRYDDANDCEYEEDEQMSHEWVLHLDFSRESLSGSIEGVVSVRDQLGSVMRTFTAMELGYRDGVDTESEEAYWKAVTDKIRRFVGSFHFKMTQLVLTGSSASRPEFKLAMKNALDGLVAEGKVLPTAVYSMLKSADRFSDSDLIYATAKGAAEIAKRRQGGPVNCQEFEECKQVRRKILRDEL